MKALTKLTMLLILMLALSTLVACGGDEGQFPASIEGAWDNNTTQFSIIFNADGTFSQTSANSSDPGVYTYDAATGRLVLTYASGQSVSNGYFDQSNVFYLGSATGNDYYGSVSQPLYTTQALAESTMPIQDENQGTNQNANQDMSQDTQQNIQQDMAQNITYPYSIAGAWDNAYLQSSFKFEEDGSYYESTSADYVASGMYYYDSTSGEIEFTEYMSDGATTTKYGYLQADNTMIVNSQDNGYYVPSSSDSPIYMPHPVAGAWDNDTSQMSIYFYDNGLCEIYSASSPDIINGYYNLDSATNTLYLYDGNQDLFQEAFFEGDRFYFNDYYDYFYRVADIGYRGSGSGAYLPSLVGSWASTDSDNKSVFLYDNGWFDIYLGNNYETGTYTYDPNYGEIVFTYDGSTTQQFGYVDEAGTLYIIYSEKTNTFTLVN